MKKTIWFLLLLLVPLGLYGSDTPKVTKYENTNCAELGVQNEEGMTPVLTKSLDRTRLLLGSETNLEFYKAQGMILGLYKIDNRIYAVAVDRDSKRPVDELYLDPEGYGKFKSFNIETDLSAPSWVIK